MTWAKLNTPHRELGSQPISRAFAVSVLAHFVFIAGLELAQAAGLFDSRFSFISGKRVMEEVIEEAQRRAEEQRLRAAEQTPEAELVFMDVDPAQAIPEPPKETKFYGAANTRAANPDPVLDLEKPKVDGKQELVPKTRDTMRPDPLALQPAPTPPMEEAKPSAQQQPEQKEQPNLAERPTEAEQPELKPPGDMLLARAAPKPQEKREPAPPKAEPRRVRTVAEAKAQKGIIEGPRMRQAGGVRRHSMDSSMDVRATPFGAYDAAFIAAVQARWFNLLDERDFVGNQSGKVVVEFNLHRDGRITMMRVADSEVSETLEWLCQRAILDPAPYRPFPADLRRLLNREYRPVRFTFYYNQ